MTNNNEQQALTEMERDVIGEVMNISMGAAATAVSTILDKKVNITTPRIETMAIEDFDFSYLDPVVGVLIKYVEGIEGNNVLIMRESDVKNILSFLLSLPPEEEAELDEIGISAVCEIMNQMMGSASSALATFLGQVVNISPPEIIDTSQRSEIRELFSLTGDSLVSIKFNLSIEGLVDSEFISAMEPKLAKKIVQMSLGAGEVDSPAGAVPAEAGGQVMTPEEDLSLRLGEPEPGPAADPVFAEPAPSSEPAVSMASVPPAPQAPAPAPAAVPTASAPPAAPRGPAVVEPVSRQVETRAYQYRPLGNAAAEGDAGENNLDLILSVPIVITVELGKTKKKIKDIADLTVGNIVELERQAGDQVDVVANGRLIARGDVVVVDDNYSVRITEIVKSRDPREEEK